MHQIISHTPLYVWAILAFLIHRGVQMSANREVAIRKIGILPLAMLGLSLQGIHNSFGFDGPAPLLWAAGATVGGALAWCSIDPAGIGADPARGLLHLRGSWWPLVWMLSLFCTKFAVAITFAMQPTWQHALPAVAGVAILYGAFSGMFVGILARQLAAYRQAQSGQPARSGIQAA